MVPAEYYRECLAPWSTVEPGIAAQKLKLRLKKAVGEGHALYRQQAVPIAQREDNNSVLYYLPNMSGTPLVAVQFEDAPDRPSSVLSHTTFYRSIHHWVAKCMIPDYRKLKGPNQHYMETVEASRGMYDGSESGWVLIDMGPDEFDGTEVYLPENIEANMSMLICDDDAHEEIVRRMLEAGVPIVKPEKMIGRVE
jgi:hypothetical protein